MYYRICQQRLQAGCRRQGCQQDLDAAATAALVALTQQLARTLQQESTAGVGRGRQASRWAGGQEVIRPC